MTIKLGVCCSEVTKITAADPAAGLKRAAEKVEKQIPRRPEGLLVMTKQKTSDGAAEAAPLQ
jgi:hypothetical protein